MTPAEEGRFLKDFGDAVSLGRAALFVGAGLSIEAGYPSWRSLLKDIAKDLRLSQNEPDLVAIAQYHINEHTGNSAVLQRELQTALADERPLTTAHHLLARLPIDVVWTTNYDRMLERSYRQNGKRPDVKYKQSHLTVFDRRGDVEIFKMHGSIDDPSDIVIARADYEGFGSQRELFQRLLLTDLLRRTFLFVGLSLSDPNLLHILGMLRAALRDNAPGHWAIMLPPTPAEDEEPEFVARRFELFVKDLKRYGVNVVVVEAPEQVTELLKRLEAFVSKRAVLISGSHPLHDHDDIGARVRGISKGVGEQLAKRRLTLVNGFGLTVGSETIAGFLEGGYADPESGSPRTQLRPFPQNSDEAFIENYRRDMVNQAGIVIVIGGVRDGKPAPGVCREVEIARERNRPVIPVGSTGGVAELIWLQMGKSGHSYDQTAFQLLGDSSAAVETVVDAVCRHITSKRQRRRLTPYGLVFVSYLLLA
jgi:NAD-dependent SIR2 family protein deacetylase